MQINLLVPRVFFVLCYGSKLGAIQEVALMVLLLVSIPPPVDKQGRLGWVGRVNKVRQLL
jgi:hypothetical protein